MRKFMFLVLLAGVATPAISVARPIDRSDEARSERADRRQQRQEQQQPQQQQQSNDNHGQRGDHGQRAEPSGGGSDRPHFGGHARSNGGNQAPAAVETGRGNGGGQSIEARRQHFGGYQRGGQNPAAQPVVTDDSRVPAQSWRSRERRPFARDEADEQQGVAVQGRRSNGSFRQYDRPPPNVMRSRVPVVSNVPRQGTQPPLRATSQSSRRHQTHRWNGNWRNDHRYNWQDRRRHHRSLFHLGFYYDPFGWGYQRYSIGWRLWPSYYSRNYWFNSAQYGLPYAPPGYQWVRYYNDALLVDTWSGQVVDVIYSFFW